MSDYDYDFLVIGGGSGGLAAARRAARHGARTAVLEPGLLGGTCVNVGCVPKKVMWNAAHMAHMAHHGAGYGFDMGEVDHDWPALVRRRRGYISRLNEIYRHNLEKDGVDLIRARARLVATDTLEAGGTRLRAQHILIATGGHPARPDIAGAEFGIDSDGFFALDERPQRVCVVGSGYIAMELACALQALGSAVTVAIRHQHVLRDFDAMLGDALMQQMRADGVVFRTQTTASALQRADDAVQIQWSDRGAPQVFDSVLWAIGRDPNTKDMGLETAGVSTDKGGFVTTDLRQNTGVDGIYALGDVTGRAQLTPVAIAAGRRLADRVFAGRADRYLDYRNIPTVVFTHPPIGSVGLSEAAARDHFGEDVHVFTSRFNDLYYGVLDDKVPSQMKIVTTGEQRRVVGCHLIGRGSDEMLQGFAVAVRMGATKVDFDDTVAIHPTAAEEMVTMT